MNIRISWRSAHVTAVIHETPTTSKLKAALPFESRAHRWGKEVYFDAPFESSLEPDAKQVVEPGTVCFWVEGGSLAIPFGPTPISKGDECRLVTRVNILGRVEGNPGVLNSIKEGDRIRVEAV
jgi:hypothetical protein